MAAPVGVMEEEVDSFFYPTTWPVEDIEPRLHFYRRDKDELVIDYTTPPEEAIASLRVQKYLASTSKITFVVHGFRNNVDTPWLTDMKEALLAESDQLVCIVSWGKGSYLLPIYYLQAAANIQAVGDWLAPYLTEIQKASPGIVQHAVGHSLGAHLIGLAGRKCDGALKRITALDPAGPAFEHKGEFMDYRLKNTDAVDMVDVIHTDGYHSKLDPTDWLAPVNHYGTLVPLGTLDFYPNYGYCQPGAGEFAIAGSHTRAIDYFIWSIGNPKKFKTNTALADTPAFETPVKEVVEVAEEAEMGYFADNASSKSGLFYVATKKSAPWVEAPESTLSSYCIIL